MKNERKFNRNSDGDLPRSRTKSLPRRKKRDEPLLSWIRTSKYRDDYGGDEMNDLPATHYERGYET